MTPEQNLVLKALYDIEEPELQRNRFDTWATPADIANRLPVDNPRYGDETWVRNKLSELWIARKVLQVPKEPVAPETLHDIILTDLDAHSLSETKLAVEDNDCRGTPPSPMEQVAIYDQKTPLRFRSRMAEVVRLLSLNYQRFNMVPATGLLRYERRQQLRPVYSVPIQSIVANLNSDIQQGRIRLTRGGEDSKFYDLRRSVDFDILCRSMNIVFTALCELFNERERSLNLAPFQVQSITATLCGIYSENYRNFHDAHVVTAGVGSGKTFAFQVGALIHVVYRALQGKRNLQVLLLYPRVVLAANQFQDLNDLVDRVVAQGIEVRHPVLDAGGQLPDQMEINRTQRGALYQSIQRAYKGNFQILISNLDTIANRLVHPEACEGMLKDLDLVVIDEIHLLSGLYGAHARMLLKRMVLMRSLWRLRSQNLDEMFETLFDRNRQHQIPPPYFIGASATISEPRRHAARLLEFSPFRVLHVDVGQTQHYGSIHHLFLRQRPEVSSITAVVNATSCLIHNRRNGLFREYYQRTLKDDTARPPISLSDLENPIRPSARIETREAQFIHKTLGFCDSLDGVGRWADLVADNERTKTASMSASPNPALGDQPYFVRFQEPLWRVVHHLTFSGNPAIWIQRLWSHYGSLCRKCKQGVRVLIDRIPSGLTQKQQNRVEELWDFREDNGRSYMVRLGIGNEFFQSEWFGPLQEASQKDRIGNLNTCPFFQTGLCWWWSMDHIGNNHPIPVANNTPLNGYKQPLNNPSRFFHWVNAIRLRHFTSQTSYDSFRANRIDDLFSAPANSIFRDRYFDRQTEENCVFVIGSPRIEVGIDLSRVCDGITFRAMRDPTSLQQKSGRVGREIMADSMVVHIVTENARDHFYFRNPRIALDPDYLQPIPLHEGNQIIAQSHYFMAILDFICLQGSGPETSKVGDYGDRLNLINDHQFQPSFKNWEKKVKAVYDFLFGSHPRQTKNLSNLVSYLKVLGARDREITNPLAIPLLASQTAPLTQSVGAVDVFEHEFGTNFLLTNLGTEEQPLTLADLCANEYPLPFALNRPDLPRHQEFFETYNTYYAGRERGPKPRLDRGYLWKLLGLPLFRRGLPLLNLPGNHPFIWASNLFQSVGLESVRVFEDIDGRRIELGYESIGLALALLVPGVVSYRYSARARKVPVNGFGAKGLTPILPRIEGVCLEVDDPEYFQPADCSDLNVTDLPEDFIGAGFPVKVYSPRQIGMISASSEPLATVDGLLADNDSRPFETGIYPLATPPRCYPLHWSRIVPSTPAEIPCRFQERFTSPNGSRLPRLPWPEVFSLFTEVVSDPSLDITEYAWGLDRQFMTRQVDPARFVYRNMQGQPIVLGHSYRAPGLCFHIEIGNCQRQHESLYSSAV